MNNGFETLIKSNNIKYKKRWRPHYVDTLENLVSKGILCDIPKELKKNIAYSLQYLEYLEFQLNELNLHSVIQTLLFKNYVITGMAIVEGLFHYILKSSGNWRKKEWKSIQKFETNDKSENGRKVRYVLEKFEKLDEIEDDEMTFDAIIKKVESKNLLDIEHAQFPYIKKYKKMRNRVHLQINEGKDDTDWYNFNEIDYLWTKYIVYCLLADNKLENKEEDLKFIELSDDQLEKIIK